MKKKKKKKKRAHLRVPLLVSVCMLCYTLQHELKESIGVLVVPVRSILLLMLDIKVQPGPKREGACVK